MPAANLDYKTVRTALAGLGQKLDELARHL